MKRVPRNLTMDIPVPLSLFLALCNHQEQTGARQEIGEMAAEALGEWLPPKRSG